MDTTNVEEILMAQGKNTVNSMESLQHRARKKDKERADLYQKFRANEHSFRVYTYMDANIGQLEEVQGFMQTVELFGENFNGVDTELDTEVDQKAVQNTYQETISAYNMMAKKLGFANESI